ncbi:hypothetical protein L1049_021566 [Liquidambar formosana]|uniref:Uncharacterized protein n=1 Tax=Liquidambar formosana TaxID=63359 RepID=A0AAP0R1Q6_LIQFO
MWKLKTVEGYGRPCLTTVNNHIGRQHWEFDPDSGTPEEQANVKRVREEYFKKREIGRLKIHHVGFWRLPPYIHMLTRSLNKELNCLLREGIVKGVAYIQKWGCDQQGSFLFRRS